PPLPAAALPPSSRGANAALDISDLSCRSRRELRAGRAVRGRRLSRVDALRARRGPPHGGCALRAGGRRSRAPPAPASARVSQPPVDIHVPHLASLLPP